MRRVVQAAERLRGIVRAWRRRQRQQRRRAAFTRRHLGPGGQRAVTRTARARCPPHTRRRGRGRLGAPPSRAVPRVDAAVHNPIGWPREAPPWTAALGPQHRLPAAMRCDRSVPPRRHRALKHCRLAVDTAHFHAGPAARAGALARLAACGVPVHLADGDAALADLLGAELHGLMAAVPLEQDHAARELTSIRIRRLALRDHALAKRPAAPPGRRAGAPWPLVSVLVATRRPALLPRAVRSVATQNYRRLELILALHGHGFAPTAPAQAAARAGIPVRIVHVPAAAPLGAALNAAAAQAAGELLTKMDDDDLYDAHHVSDLVLAYRYSGATLVGKGIEHVYLGSTDETIRRDVGHAETYSPHLAGGALLIARRDLARVGGWRPLGVGEDLALIDDVRRIGAIYRTHGAGFLLVRHGHGHSWTDLDETRFRSQAETVLRGWRPALAGIDDAAPVQP